MPNFNVASVPSPADSAMDETDANAFTPAAVVAVCATLIVSVWADPSMAKARDRCRGRGIRWSAARRGDQMFRGGEIAPSRSRRSMPRLK